MYDIIFDTKEIYIFLKFFTEKGAISMGGIFGVVSKNDCVFDLFFGIDYHSHLGTKRGGMVVYGEDGFERAIHNIQNSPFRTKFERDFDEMKGNLGVGCISDNEPQPLIVRSHLGNFAITTVGRINNIDNLVENAFKKGTIHFLEMSGGDINPTELTAALINTKDSITEGIQYAQSVIDGSVTMLVLTSEGIYAARDKYGRTPLIIGKKDGSYCASVESFAYLNLGYETCRELGPGEVVYITPESVETLVPAGNEMKICTFMWVYYGNPASTYENVNVEEMRYNCGAKLAMRDGNIGVDTVSGIPDSGLAHAIGYANSSHIPFSRPLIKYTHTWARSFMPVNQSQRNLVARMKLLPIHELIHDKKLLFIDDSLVRGTQLRETAEFLYRSGAKEVHIRLACPPLIYGCPYLNFSRSSSEMDLITRRTIDKFEGTSEPANLDAYADPDSPEYNAMVEDIRKERKFTTLKYLRLDDMIEATGIAPCKLCTYCWNGKK